MRVAERNPFLAGLETPLEPGEHDAIVVGYFLLITSLEKGSTGFNLEERGEAVYRTDAVYDVQVDEHKLKGSVRNISENEKPTSVALYQDLFRTVQTWDSTRINSKNTESVFVTAGKTKTLRASMLNQTRSINGCWVELLQRY